MREAFQLGQLKTMPGEKTEAFFPVPGTNMQMPVTIVHGEKEGKVMLITAGVHGGEYPGIVAAISLAKELDPKEISGTVIIIHPVVVSGFEQKDSSRIPEDGKNLNRLFPGDPNGTEGDKLAHLITAQFHAISDYNIDLHAGNYDEDLIPFVFFPAAGTDEVTEQSKKMAEVCDVRYLVKSVARTGLYNSAAIEGVPAILLERGGNGLWSQKEVDQDKKDVLAVLRLLGFLEGAPPEKTAAKMLDEVRYIDADATGCWYPATTPGERVQKGESLGEIRGYFDEVLATYTAPFDGTVLYQVSSLAAIQGRSLIAFGKVDD